MPFIPSSVVSLPIGFEKDGTRYREVHIDEMRGVDEDNLTDKKIRNNGAKSITRILQRCIQAIPGVYEQKSNPDELVPTNIVNAMKTPDRDFLFLAILALGSEQEFDATMKCPACRDGVDEHHLSFKDLDVYEWEDSVPLEIPISLDMGFMYEGKEYKDIVWRFPDGAFQEKLASLPESKIGSAALSGCCYIPELKINPDTHMCKRLPTRQRQALMEEVGEQTPGVDLRRDCICDSCSHEWVGDIDLGNFFGKAKDKKKDSKSGKRGRLLKKRA